MAKEIFSTTVVECRGKRNKCDDNGMLRFPAALDVPVQALVTTFRDGTRTVCCSHVARADFHPGRSNCRAAEGTHFGAGVYNEAGDILPAHDSFPDCAFLKEVSSKK